MSCYTQLIAVAQIDLMNVFLPVISASQGAPIDQKDIDRKAQSLLDCMPAITGSEGNAERFLNRLDWVGLSVPEHPGMHDGRYLDYKFKYIIVICGTLYDRKPKDTEDELDEAVKYLMDNVNVFPDDDNVKLFKRITGVD